MFIHKMENHIKSLHYMGNLTNSGAKYINGPPCTLLKKMPTTTFLTIEHVMIAGPKLENTILDLFVSFKL